MADKEMKRMSLATKNKLGNALALIVVILCFLIPLTIAVGENLLFWFMIIVNFVFGPLCLVAYRFEVKKGVFAYDDDEEEAPAEAE